MNNGTSEKSDALLKAAFEEYCREQEESLPGEDELRDRFPPKEDECEKYCKKARRIERGNSAAMKALRRAAVIALAVTLTAFGVLMLNEDVRAAVLGLFVGQTEDGSTVVRFSGSDDESEPVEEKSIYDVSVGYVPEGFVLNEIQDEALVGNFRIILLNGEDTPANSVPFARVDIRTAGKTMNGYDAEFSPNSFDYFSQTTVRGMDAFYTNDMDYIDEAFIASSGYGPEYFEGGLIIFGDGSIVVDVLGCGISIDELFKIAESVVW